MNPELTKICYYFSAGISNQRNFFRFEKISGASKSGNWKFHNVNWQGSLSPKELQKGEKRGQKGYTVSWTIVHAFPLIIPAVSPRSREISVVLIVCARVMDSVANIFSLKV